MPGVGARPAARVAGGPGAVQCARGDPAGAFVLFRGEAWDAEYDGLEEVRRGRVPAEILGSRGRGRP